MRMLHPEPAARPDLQRCVHGAEPVGRRVSFRRRPHHARRDRHDDPVGRREHDGGRRSAHGRGGRPPRRRRRAPAAGHSGGCASRASIGWVKRRHPVFETPITLSPSNTVGDALEVDPQACARCGDRDRRRGTPDRCVHRAGRHRLRPFHPAPARHERPISTRCPSDVTPEAGLRAPSRRSSPVARARRRRRWTAARVDDRAGAPLRSTIYRPAVDDRRPPVGRPSPSGINADPVGPVGGARARAGRRRPGPRHRPRASDVDARRRSRRCARAACPEAKHRGRQRRDRRRAPASWSRRGADIVKVGVGPGAMCTTRA